MSNTSQRVSIVLMFALTALLGCGESANSTTVQGKITFNGAPVTFGLINFKPTKGQPLGGEIQPDGTFRYDLPPGDYQVRIDSPPPIPAGQREGETTPSTPPAKPGQGQVPPKFANFDTSGLTATIGNESPQQLDFTLP